MQLTNNQQVEVKAAFGEVKRRFLVKIEPQATYKNLITQISTLFSLPTSDLTCIRIEYEDDEGDFITVSSEEEVLVAIQVQSRMWNSRSNPPPVYPLLRLVISQKILASKRGTPTTPLSVTTASPSSSSKIVKRTSVPTTSVTTSTNEAMDIDETSAGDLTVHDSDHSYGGSNKATDETCMSTASSDSAKTRRNRKKKLAKKTRVIAKKEEKELKKQQKKLQQQEKERLKQQKLIEKELRREEIKLAKEHKRLEKELIKTDDYDLTKDWPKNIKYLYLDGNNMLFICSSFRKYACKRSTRHYTEQLLNIIALDFHNSSNLILSQVCYDKTALMPKYPGYDKLFVVTSAIPDFNTADDQLVAIAFKQKQLKLLDYSMFITTDKLLRKRLKDMGAKVASPGAWLKCAHKYLSSLDLSISNNLDEWTDSLIVRLGLPSFKSVGSDDMEIADT
jgi:hypothetical protein